MLNINDDIKNLIDKISNNKIEEVLNYLVKNLVSNSSLHNISIQQKRRFRGLTEELQKGTISFEEMQLAVNKITDVILGIVKSLSEKDFKAYEENKLIEINEESFISEIENSDNNSFSKYYYIETIKDIIESNYLSQYFLEGKNKIFVVKKLEVEFFRNEIVILYLYERRKDRLSKGLWHPRSFDREILETIKFSIEDLDRIQFVSEGLKSVNGNEEDEFCLKILMKEKKYISIQKETYKEDVDDEMYLFTDNKSIISYSLPLRNKNLIKAEIENSFKVLIKNIK